MLPLQGQCAMLPHDKTFRALQGSLVVSGKSINVATNRCDISSLGATLNSTGSLQLEGVSQPSLAPAHLPQVLLGTISESYSLCQSLPRPARANVCQVGHWETLVSLRDGPWSTGTTERIAFRAFRSLVIGISALYTMSLPREPATKPLCWVIIGSCNGQSPGLARLWCMISVIPSVSWFGDSSIRLPSLFCGRVEAHSDTGCLVLLNDFQNSLSRLRRLCTYLLGISSHPRLMTCNAHCSCPGGPVSD